MVKPTIDCGGWSLKNSWTQKNNVVSANGWRISQSSESAHPGLIRTGVASYGPGLCFDCYEMLRGRLSIVGAAGAGALAVSDLGGLSLSNLA